MTQGPQIDSGRARIVFGQIDLGQVLQDVWTVTQAFEAFRERVLGLVKQSQVQGHAEVRPELSWGLDVFQKERARFLRPTKQVVVQVPRVVQGSVRCVQDKVVLGQLQCCIEDFKPLALARVPV